MIASSWMDPVLGIDMHWEMVPTPAPVPMPFPHPFIGIVLDPAGLASSLAMNAVMAGVFGAPFQGPVLNWILPATNTGTNARHVPGHFIIPPGTFWAPVPRTPKPKIRPGEVVVPAPPIMPENDASSILGSKTVHIGGTNAVRLGDLFLSCSEPVRLPSSVVLAIPKGAPILIGGPPALDWMAAITGSLRTRFVSDSLHALVSRLAPGRLRSFLNRAVCFFTGHPVDVASGKVMTSAVDAELPGPLPLRIERVYSSAFADRDGPLGHGWSLSLDQAIWTEPGKVVLLEADGREVEFDAFDLPGHRMRPGDRLWHPIERLELECLEGGRWRVRAAADGVEREFGPVAGRRDGRASIARTRSRCGHHEIAYEYDALGRLEWVRDACGRLVWLERDAAGRLRALKLPVPSGEGWYVHRKYAYDDAGDLVQVTDALAHSWRFAYVTHLLVRETDRTGLSFYFEYDGLGQDAWCTRTWGDGGIYDHRLAYDKVKKVTFVTNSLGHTTQYRMNVAGLVVKVVDPLGGTTAYEHDARTLQKTAEIDPLGNVERYAFDARGNCIEWVGPDGATLRDEYDSSDRVVSETDACGGTWSWEYHPVSGLLARERDPLGGTTEFQAANGLLRAVVDAQGGRTEFIHDAAGNLVSIIDADGREERRWYDRVGRELGVRDGGGGERLMSWDLGGWLTEIREPDGNVRRFTRDAEGNVVYYRDALRQIHYGHAGLHEVAWQEEDGASTRAQYDSEGNLVAITNELGEQQRFVLDPRGTVVEEIGFHGRRRGYLRDKAGRVVLETRPSGLTTSVVYDPAGRLVRLAHSDGTQEEFGYRPDGELAWAANEMARVTFGRDGLGNLVEELHGEDAVWSRYDATGMREAVVSSRGTRQSLLRSRAGAVRELIAYSNGPGACTVAFTLDSLGAEAERHLPGGITGGWERDRAARPTGQSIRSPRGVLSTRRYSWSFDERLDAIEDGGGGRTRFLHDGRGRLTAVESPGGERQHRAPDLAGNPYRTSDRRDRSYAPGGRLEGAGGVRYVYDLDGNLVEKRQADGGAWRYAWNAAGHLRQITRPDGRQIEFGYDALGRRIWKRSPEGETRFVWDWDVLLHEVSSTEGLTTWHHEPEGFGLVAKEHGGRHYGVITDHLGTPIEIYDDQGVLAWRLHLDGYGAGTPEPSTTACPWRWPGQYQDAETGLHYNRFRYYDPEMGIYISEDPLRLAERFDLHGYVPLVGLWASVAPLWDQGGFGSDPTDVERGLGAYLYPGDPLVWMDFFGLSRIGGSGKPRMHFVQHGSRKAALEAAGKGAQGHMRHAKRTVRGQRPHYHPAGAHAPGAENVHHMYGKAKKKLHPGESSKKRGGCQ